jgi:cell division protein FtsL
MSIKLSYRDKVILIVLIVLVILIAGVMVFVRPKFDQSNVKKTELDNKTTEQATIQEKIETLDDLQRQILTSINDIDAYQQIFYTEGKHYEMEQLFHSLIDESRLNISKLTFTTGAEQISDYLFTPSVGLLMYSMKVNADLYNALPPELYNYMNGIQAQSNGTVAIGVTSFSASFENLNTWNQLYEFLDNSANSNKSIYVTTIESRDATPDGGTADINVKIYHIVPMDTLAVWNAEKEIAEAQEPNNWAEISAGMTAPTPVTPAVPSETA